MSGQMPAHAEGPDGDDQDDYGAVDDYADDGAGGADPLAAFNLQPQVRQQI